MAFHPGTCQISGCIRSTMSLGKRKNHSSGRRQTYYSTFCRFHQKAYNRPKIYGY